MNNDDNNEGKLPRKDGEEEDGYEEDDPIARKLSEEIEAEELAVNPFARVEIEASDDTSKKGIFYGHMFVNLRATPGNTNEDLYMSVVESLLNELPKEYTKVFFETPIFDFPCYKIPQNAMDVLTKCIMEEVVLSHSVIISVVGPPKDDSDSIVQFLQAVNKNSQKNLGQLQQVEIDIANSVELDNHDCPMLVAPGTEFVPTFSKLYLHNLPSNFTVANIQPLLEGVADPKSLLKFLEIKFTDYKDPDYPDPPEITESALDSFFKILATVPDTSSLKHLSLILNICSNESTLLSMHFKAIADNIGNIDTLKELTIEVTNERNAVQLGLETEAMLLDGFQQNVSLESIDFVDIESSPKFEEMVRACNLRNNLQRCHGFLLHQAKMYAPTRGNEITQASPQTGPVFQNYLKIDRDTGNDGEAIKAKAQSSMTATPNSPSSGSPEAVLVQMTRTPKQTSSIIDSLITAGTPQTPRGSDGGDGGATPAIVLGTPESPSSAATTSVLPLTTAGVGHASPPILDGASGSSVSVSSPPVPGGSSVPITPFYPRDVQEAKE